MVAPKTSANKTSRNTWPPNFPNGIVLFPSTGRMREYELTIPFPPLYFSQFSYSATHVVSGLANLGKQIPVPVAPTLLDHNLEIENERLQYSRPQFLQRLQQGLVDQAMLAPMPDNPLGRLNAPHGQQTRSE
jgi:hypothetical protein